MSPATLTFVMLLAVGGLVAAYVAKKVFAKADGPPPIGTTNVPMALMDLEPGTQIEESDIAMGPLRNDKRERDMILSKDVLIGRVVKEPIKGAQPIRSSQLYGSGQRPDLPVRPGFNAVSISLGDGPSIVDGAVKPGALVNVHFTPSVIPNNDPRYQSGFIMQLFSGVKVLAVNRRTRPSNVQTQANTATLELTPKQTNIILLAQQKGRLSLSLNTTGPGNGDIELENAADRVTLEEILGIEPPAPPKKPFEMEVYYGSGRSTVEFDDGHYHRGYDRANDNIPRGYPRERTGTRGINGQGLPAVPTQPDPDAGNERQEVTSPLEV